VRCLALVPLQESSAWNDSNSTAGATASVALDCEARALEQELSRRRVWREWGEGGSWHCDTLGPDLSVVQEKVNRATLRLAMSCGPEDRRCNE
jgi:hypothetical protein